VAYDQKDTTDPAHRSTEESFLLDNQRDASMQQQRNQSLDRTRRLPLGEDNAELNEHHRLW
jgi:hypothetical protein